MVKKVNQGVEMKPRKVVIVIEAKSDWKTKELKSYYSADAKYIEGIDIHQVSVQVVKEEK